MYPINDSKGINEQESQLEGRHVIVLLFIKPSDYGANNYIEQFNYIHYKSKGYCSIYLVGYSLGFDSSYLDVQEIKGIDNQRWQYSDRCFIDVCNELEDRLSKWRYSGEPEMIILQNKSPERTRDNLDFRNYYYLDINYGIKKGYIDSFPRFMERFLQSCKESVTAKDAVTHPERSRIKTRNIVELAIENCPKLPAPVKQIMQDGVFFKSYKS